MSTETGSFGSGLIVRGTIPVSITQGGDFFVNGRSKSFDPYNGKDPRDIPAYTAAQAAHYQWVPEGTLRTWTRGREYPSGKGYSAPVVSPADPAGGILSFVNLLELHVLSAIRRHHGVDMRRVRHAVSYLAERYGHKHPLIDEKMETDGSHLFIQKLGQLENISENGQLAMRAVLAFQATRSFHRQGNCGWRCRHPEVQVIHA